MAEGRGSRWVIDYVEGGYIDVAIYKPFAGGMFIWLPPSLAVKKAIVNVKNNDDQCLKWAMRSVLFPATKNAGRPSKYPENNGLNWGGMEFPTKVPEIRKLEKQNQGLAINVWGWENDELTILWISDKSKAIKRINLMLLMDGEKSHHCWIKDMSRLIHNKTKHKGRHFYCTLCLLRFNNERVLKTHQELCEGVNGRPTRIDMPENGKNTLKFVNHQKQQKAPYVIYADFESIIEALPKDARYPTERTEKTVRHVASGFAYTVVRSDGKSWSRKYRQGAHGETSAAEECLESILREEESSTAEDGTPRLAQFQNRRKVLDLQRRPLEGKLPGLGPSAERQNGQVLGAKPQEMPLGIHLHKR